MIKGILKWLLGVLAAFALLFFSLFIILLIVTDREPVVVDNSYLHIPLSGSLPEYEAPDPLAKALGRATLDMKQVRDVLEKARVDDRINGVVLELEYLQCGFGKLEELHHLITRFRESDKPVFAYLGPDLAFGRDYYVASACDSIFMPPSANLFLNGVSSEVTFYKDFLKKFGIKAEFAQIGKYKNAPDVYTRNSMSDPHREVLTNIIDKRYRELLQVVAKNRDFSPEQTRHLMEDVSAFTGREAQGLGLIDRSAYLNDFTRQLSANTRKPKRLSAVTYADVPASSLKIRNKSRIAVINCVGAIGGGKDREDPYFGKMMGSETVIDNLERATKSKSIKAIILRVDSPGGSATASEAIWHAIRKARKSKPVIASVSDYGASGGYYISMAADTMLTSPGSLVGSIGIFAGKFSIDGLYRKLDIKTETISAGKNSTLFSLTMPWSPSERQIIERLIGNFYQDFVTKAAESRDLTFDEVDRVARGHVWTGAEAVENRLFDATGYFYDAVEAARQMAGLDSTESLRLVYYPREKSMFDELFANGLIFVSRLNPVRQVEGFLRRIQGKSLALMPFILD